jgi:TPR repeat protein
VATGGEWLARWKELADSGDPDAQIVVAWEYVKGKLIPKDFDRAVALFKAAERSKGRLARFNLAKAMLLNRDPSFRNVISDDCAAGFGPALYLMGVSEAKGIFGNKNLDEAVRYFSLAARDGHITSEFFAWRLQRKSVVCWIRTMPYAVRLTLRYIPIYLADSTDLRVTW